MTIVTVTAHPETGSNRITINPTSDVEQVLRTDAKGTHPVRTMAGVLPHAETGGVLTLDDYEASNGPSTYTVHTIDLTYTETAILELDSLWLGTPEAPQFSLPVPSVTQYQAGTQTLSTVHEPEGRRDPIVIVRGASSRRGSLTLEAGSYAAALDQLRLCQRGQTMLLRQSQHAGMDMYFVAMNADIVTRLAAGPRSLFDVSVQYIEVARPSGALTGSLGWSWGSLSAAFATWADVSNAYASWGDVRTNVRKP